RQVSPVDVDREIEMLKERVEQESMANPSIPAQTTASTDTTKPTPTQPSTAPDTQTRAEAESKPQTTEQTTEESVSPIPDEQKEKPGADAEEIDDFDIDEELV
ncbi:hypothetical protein KY318_02385, partial [Candidatus Woesearchaeota archaeon]|nr:hypothetical protein [Candidatus Woesearchaeota archaeon]